MNIMLFAVLIIFLVCVVIGYRRGLIRLLGAFVSMIATLILVTVLAPTVSDLIMKVVSLEETMQNKCVEWMLPDETTDREGFVDSLDAKDAQTAAIEKSKLPKMMREKLLENNNNAIYKALGVDTFLEYVGSYLAKLIANIISYIVLWILISIVVRLLVRRLDIINKIPLVGLVNRVAGAGLGVVNAVIVVWLLFLIITLMYDTSIGAACLEDINNHSMLKWLYDRNILMNTLTKYIG